MRCAEWLGTDYVGGWDFWTLGDLAGVIFFRRVTLCFPGLKSETWGTLSSLKDEKCQTWATRRMIRSIFTTGGQDVFDAYTAQSKTIGDLLSDSLKGTVVVPQFQRGYSWGKKHVEDFWADVAEFQKESLVKGGRDAHFLGPIVVMQNENDKLKTYILDGQQRLATATILFSVLRDLAYELQTSEGKSFGDDVQNHLITKEDYGFCLQMGVLGNPCAGA